MEAVTVEVGNMYKVRTAVVIICSLGMQIAIFRSNGMLDFVLYFVVSEKKQPVNHLRLTSKSKMNAWFTDFQSSRHISLSLI